MYALSDCSSEANMENSWIIIDDDGDISSDHSNRDSDHIDSETEAELYSKIHYEEHLPGGNSVDSECVKPQPSDLLVCPQNQVGNILGANEKKGNVQQCPLSMTEIFFLVDTNRIETAEKCSDSETVIKANPNSSSCKKRKSSSVERSPSVILCLSDSDDSCKLKYTTQNKKAKLSSSQSKSASEKNCLATPDSVGKSNTVIVSSSESDREDNFVWKPLNSQERNDSQTSDSDEDDSFIWKSLDSQEKSDLQTNLSDSKLIFLDSSDSDSESGNVSCTYLNRNSILRNLSMPNLKVEESSGDQWFINEEDLYRRKRYGTPRRYHDKEMVCSNCSKKGHSFRSCPAPRDIKCYICGGRHIGNRCYNRICSNCYSYGHDIRTCNRSFNYSSCSLCKVRGHMTENCPDIWRRYHLTTEPTNDIKRSKRDSQVQDVDMYCWNCGQLGHFGAVCPYGSGSRSGTSTWPCVISYNNPRKLLARRLFVNFGINEKRVKKAKKQKQNRISNPYESTSYHKENRSEESQTNEMVPKSQKLKPVRSNKKEKNISEKSKINRFEKIVRQKEFPRTKRMKKSNEPMPLSDEPMPEVVNKKLERKERRRQRNRMRQQKKKIARLEKREHLMKKCHG